jgi:hypothetical protein
VAKNLTIALDDRLLANARQYAQARGQSLNELLRQLLAEAIYPSTAGPQHTFQLMDRIDAKPSTGKWRRQDLYRRLK